MALLAWRGRWPERVAALGFLTVMVTSPMVAHLHIEGFRWGVALLSAGLLITLFLLSLTAERWWLMAASGLQIVAFSTWLAALIEPSAQIWAAVTIRMVVWLQLMAVALFGVWEARTAPYAKPSANQDQETPQWPPTRQPHLSHSP